MSGQAIVTINEEQWSVDVATTPSELMQGLGGIQSIPVKTGMLFDTQYSQMISVTTYPMLFNIDVAFISEELIITDIYRNVVPECLVYAEHLAKYFIEVNANELEGVEVGDSVIIEYLILPTPPTFWEQLQGMFIQIFPFIIFGMFVIGMIKMITTPEKKSGLEYYPAIYGEPRRRLVEKYGSWAVGRAEAVCAEDDIAAVEREAKRLSETLKARYGEERMKYYTIINPGQTVFYPGDVVSQVNLEEENRRVRALGENEATYQVASPKTIPTKRERVSKLPPEIEYLPDSPEFLAYTISDIGYADKLENAFRERMLKVRSS